MHSTYILSALALAIPVYSLSSTASMGCYSDIGDMKSQGPFTYQSPGYCQDRCSKNDFKVAALGRGDVCYCGNNLPSQAAKVDDNQCDHPCPGFPAEMCGGQDTYTVIQATELTPSSGSDSDSGASTTAAPTAATAAGGIIVAASTASTSTGIVTAASSINSKSANAASSKTSASAAVTSTVAPTPTGNAAGTIRVGSSLVGVVVAGMGLLL